MVSDGEHPLGLVASCFFILQGIPTVCSNGQRAKVILEATVAKDIQSGVIKHRNPEMSYKWRF